jgi:protein PhnA
MNVKEEVFSRSGGACELCGATADVVVYEVTPVTTGGVDGSLLACSVCISQIEHPDTLEANHWRCLNDSMWSSVPAVQVMVWRILNHLKGEGWPQDLLEQLYMEDEVLEWAKAGSAEPASRAIIHRDSNGNILQAGDSVVLIKDLKVKGSSMVAKQGTAVRRISLDHENEKYIEGKVDGQHIVIITDFVKKM